MLETGLHCKSAEVDGATNNQQAVPAPVSAAQRAAAAQIARKTRKLIGTSRIRLRWAKLTAAPGTIHFDLKRNYQVRAVPLVAGKLCLPATHCSGIPLAS